MATECKNDLESFHQFVGDRLKSGGANLSPEQVLALWRDRLETVEAIREGLDDVKAGRVRPAGEVLEELRGKLDVQQDR